MTDATQFDDDHEITERGLEAATIYGMTKMFVFCCAPAGMQREVVETQINADVPRADGRCYRILEGEPLGCFFDAGRMHWVLSCRGEETP